MVAMPQSPAQQANVPQGAYRSDVFPLLGVVAAICLSNAERELFWEEPPKHPEDPFNEKLPRQFCDVLYGLKGRTFKEKPYTALLLAPGYNDPLERPCIPTESQINELVDALEQELAGKRPVEPPFPDVPPFDIELVPHYKVVAQVYEYFLRGGAPLASDWAKSLRDELEAGAEAERAVW